MDSNLKLVMISEHRVDRCSKRGGIYYRLYQIEETSEYLVSIVGNAIATAKSKGRFAKGIYYKVEDFIGLKCGDSNKRLEGARRYRYLEGKLSLCAGGIPNNEKAFLKAAISHHSLAAI